MTAKLLLNDESCGNRRVYCKKFFRLFEKTIERTFKNNRDLFEQVSGEFTGLFYAHYGVGFAVDVYPVGLIITIQ